MKKILLLIIISIQIPGLLSAQDDTKIFRHGQLDNGLTYYVRHTTMQPGKADFYLVQNVGALMEEDNQNGLAHFLEHMAVQRDQEFQGGYSSFPETPGCDPVQCPDGTGRNGVLHDGRGDGRHGTGGFLPSRDERLVGFPVAGPGGD